MQADDTTQQKIQLTIPDTQDDADTTPIGGLRVFQAYKSGKYDTKVLESATKTSIDSAVTRTAPATAASTSHAQSLHKSNQQQQEEVKMVQAPKITKVGGASSINSIIVNSKQRGNPLLQYISNVAWEYSDSVEPDYILARNVCALFLSLRYHNVNPDYIHERLKRLGQTYQIQLLIAQIDVKDPHYQLKELSKLCFTANICLVLAWSPEEAARYLETYKAFENKPPDTIQAQKAEVSDPLGQGTDFLTCIPSVNKTDAASLLKMFKSVRGVMEADEDALAMCPGMGSQKVKRLKNAFHMPFRKEQI